MKPRRLAFFAILTLALAPLLPAQGGDDGIEVRTMHGIYTSGFSGGIQRLRAEFTPRDEGGWTVEFFFKWSGEDRVYRGVAGGSLSEGRLFGQVHDENKSRLFNFHCEFDKKKRCKGKHAEVVRTGEHETGTITLRH